MKDLEACYERWKAAANRRRKIALQLMSGKREWDDRWPAWVRFDLESEIALIERERSDEAAAAERQRQRHAAKERRKQQFLDGL